MQEQAPQEHALGETRTHGIDLDRHAGHLPSHRVQGKPVENKVAITASVERTKQPDLVRCHIRGKPEHSTVQP